MTELKVGDVLVCKGLSFFGPDFTQTCRILFVSHGFVSLYWSSGHNEPSSFCKVEERPWRKRMKRWNSIKLNGREVNL